MAGCVAVPYVRELLRDTQRVALVALGAGALGATTAATVAPAELRDWFGLTPQQPVSIAAAELWLNNMRVLLLVFAAAAAVTWWPRARVLTDAVLLVVVGGNVLLVAVALGAYGHDLLALAPAHYALELLAISVADAAYLHARRHHDFNAPVMTLCALIAATLLALGAALEAAAA